MRYRPIILCLIVLFTLNTKASAETSEEEEIANTLVRQMADFVTMTLADMDPAQPGIIPRNASHTHDPDPCYPMAYLYKTDHPLNPYYGDLAVRDRAIAICDYIAKTKMRPEWPLYLVDQVYGLLEEEISTERRLAWKEYARDYIETRGMRPYFFTSPNHEAWNALAIFRAGQVFGEPSWMEHGKRLMQQLIKLQTDLGYFDEGHHHGPAMKYNQVQLAPMLLYADYAGDPLAEEASKRLADFMIRYSYPDGSPIGTFDGRQSYSLGFYGTLCYGLDRWPMGKELNRRIFRTRKQWDILEVSSPYYAFSEWYAYFGIFFMLDEYLSLLPSAPVATLPQDEDGYRMVEQGSSFDGGVIRKNDWMVSMAAHISDVPRYRGGPYQLDRQSRLDIWHERTGLIIGGGHGAVGSNPPLANFLLLTGHGGVTASHGLLEGGSVQQRRAAYSPRAATTRMETDRQELGVSFGHGDFSFETSPISPTQLGVKYQYDVLAADRALVQLPLIIFHNSSVSVDGESYDGSKSLPVNRRIAITNPTTGTAVTIRVPREEKILLREAVYPLRWYGGNHKDQRYRPYYQIALLSLQIDEPQKGGGSFLLEVSE